MVVSLKAGTERGPAAQFGIRATATARVRS